MSTQSAEKHISDASCDSCHNDCPYIKKDSLPGGIAIIPGSGKLFEYPIKTDNVVLKEGPGILDFVKSIPHCPEIYEGIVCIKECCEFAAVAGLNFINGDLVINSPCISENCDKLAGDLFLQNDALNIFPNLLGVNGTIYIVGTDYKRITGFEKLKYVTGSIVIVNNHSLVQIPSFPSLVSISGKPVKTPEVQCARAALIIAANPCLRRITGFDTLRQVKDGIFIANNGSLTHICGFIHLYRTDRIVIASNENLNNIVGFCYLDTVNSGLYILDNNCVGTHDLELRAFVALEVVEHLVIIGNRALKEVKLEKLEDVDCLIVRSNPHLATFSSSVKYVNSLYIEDNKSLQKIILEELLEVKKYFNLNKNAGLIVLDTFNKLKRVGAGILIADNSELLEIKGFKVLKYIGSRCAIKTPSCEENECCECTAHIHVDWCQIIHVSCKEIIDEFQSYTYDTSSTACAYQLPEKFFKLICGQANNCHCPHGEEHGCVPVVTYSLNIFRNFRLKAIGSFLELKNVESNIFIVANTALHTIHGFTKLSFALDVWIRNQPNLKYVIGFGNLKFVRNLVGLETVCLLSWDSLVSLEAAQHIAIESKTKKSVKLPKRPIPSVSGYILYYAFDHGKKPQ